MHFNAHPPLEKVALHKKHMIRQSYHVQLNHAFIPIKRVSPPVYRPLSPRIKVSYPKGYDRVHSGGLQRE
jgi:hypothetical protein